MILIYLFNFKYTIIKFIIYLTNTIKVKIPKVIVIIGIYISKIKLNSCEFISINVPIPI